MPGLLSCLREALSAQAISPDAAPIGWFLLALASQVNKRMFAATAVYASTTMAGDLQLSESSGVRCLPSAGDASLIR